MSRLQADGLGIIYGLYKLSVNKIIIFTKRSVITREII